MKTDHDMQATTTPAINTRSGWRPLLRPIGQLLIAAQLALVLQPLSVLAQDKRPLLLPATRNQVSILSSSPTSLAQATAQSSSGRVSDELTRAQELVFRIKRASVDDKAAKMRELKQTLTGIQASIADVRSDFAATRDQLQQRNLATEILSRHDQAVAQFDQRVVQFNQIAGRPSDDQVVEELAVFFKQNPHTKRHTPIDPSKLPWRAPDATPRMPAETKTAWYRKLNGEQKVLLAQAGGLTTIGGVGFIQPPAPTLAPQDADLAETPDVQLTPAIRVKAQELGNNPLNIQNWVRNSVQWLPTWGSIQGADGTLRAMRGNAFDTASLTIALLRANGIPARYQFGTIDLPADQVMNWTGGVQRPEAALNLLYQGGIAARGISSSGRIATIRMEHVWVNAFVNWSPSRGGRQGGNTVTPTVLNSNGQAQHPNPNGPLNAWVPIDPSFKQYTFAPGIDVNTVPIDANGLINAVQQGATVTPHYVQNLNQANLRAQLENYQNQFQSYIKSQNPNATVSDVIGARTIQTRTASLLAGVTPFPVAVQGSETTEIPDSLRWKVSFFGYALDGGGGGGQGPTLIDRTFNLSELLTGRVGVTYEGATPADQQAIASYRANGATSFPAYALNVRPLFQIDGVTVGAGQTIGMARDVEWRVNIIPAGLTAMSGNQQTYAASAGDEMVWAVVADAVSAAQLQGMNFPASAAGNLHAVGMSFWHQADAYAQLIARREHALVQRMPSLGAVSSALTVQFIWGIPRSAFYRGRTIDIGHSTIGLQGADSAAFLRELGGRMSYLEGNIFDQVFSRETGSGLSAIRLIQTALESGERVFTLNSGNADQFLGLIQMSNDVREDITNSLIMGLEVTIPEYTQQVNGWQGTAYIAIRPETGAGSYNISGGLRGGDEGTECALQPSTSPATATNFTPAVMFVAAIIVLLLIARIGPILGPVAVVMFAVSQAANAVPVPQLPSSQNAIWNRLSGGRPWPSQFNWPPAGSYLDRGLCSADQHAALMAAQQLACSKPSSCKGTDSCSDLEIKRQNAQDCISARLDVMDTCYQGGDAEHWGQISERLNGLATCVRCLAKQESAQQCTAGN